MKSSAPDKGFLSSWKNIFGSDSLLFSSGRAGREAVTWRSSGRCSSWPFAAPPHRSFWGSAQNPRSQERCFWNWVTRSVWAPGCRKSHTFPCPLLAFFPYLLDSSLFSTKTLFLLNIISLASRDIAYKFTNETVGWCHCKSRTCWLICLAYKTSRIYKMTGSDLSI